MQVNDKCPYIKFEHNFYPDNTCSCKWTYCTHPGDFKDCDTYKLHQRTKEALFNGITPTKIGEENGVNEEQCIP